MTAAPVAPQLAPLLRRRQVTELTRAARELGSPAHLVGGAIRDALLGQTVHDLDAVVAGQGRQIAERLAHRLKAKLVAIGGERFAAYRIVGATGELDLWDREDASITADLARRDLTVNALALDLETHEFLDPFHGHADLRARRLRAVTTDSFSGDPLRVLRLARFALQLPGFGPDQATLDLARQAAQHLDTIAAERIREELRKLYSLNGTERALTILHQIGLFPNWWLGTEPTEPDSEYLHLLNRARETLQRLPIAVQRATEADGKPISTEQLRVARWALTLLALDPPTPAPTVLHSLNERSFLSREETRAIEPLLVLPTPPSTIQDQRRYLHQAGDDWQAALLVTTTQTLATAPDSPWLGAPLKRLLQLAHTHGSALAHPPRFLDGHEVRELLQTNDGRAIGQALAALDQAWIDGKITTRDEALRLLSTLR